MCLINTALHIFYRWRGLHWKEVWLSETDKPLSSQLHDCARAQCFRAFFFPALFVVRIEYLNITSACETAWVVNCESEIPQNRDRQKGYVTCPGLSTDLKTPRCESLNPGLEIHIQIFCNCSSIKRFKVKPQAPTQYADRNVFWVVWCWGFFHLLFPFLSFLSLDDYHRCYPLSVHLHGYPLQTFSISQPILGSIFSVISDIATNSILWT